MDLHIYTRELLDKHLLPELKEIAQSLGIIPEGNKTRRETWVAALVGKPCPVFQSIENSLDAEVDPAEEPIVHAPESEKSSGVEFDPAQAPLMEAAETSPGVEFDPAQAPLMEAAETSPGVEFDPAQVPLMEVAETSPGCRIRSSPGTTYGSGRNFPRCRIRSSPGTTYGSGRNFPRCRSRSSPGADRIPRPGICAGRNRPTANSKRRIIKSSAIAIRGNSASKGHISGREAEP